MNKNWNTVLWICQALLAAGFIIGAYLKLTYPITELGEMWPWAGENPRLVRITGVLDLVTGIGLVLPGLLKIRPSLIIWAAFGTVLMMLGAIVFHVSRGEGSDIGINIAYFLLAAFTAWGRLKKAPTLGKTTQV